MMDLRGLETALSELPLYEYFYFTTDELTFSDRIRWICEHECPMLGSAGSASMSAPCTAKVGPAHRE